MAELQEYKCPCCSGKLEFNSSVQKMKCPYCDSEFEVEAVEEYNRELQKNSSDGEMKWESSPGDEWAADETKGMNVYTCQSCGGEIIVDETTTASKCPYCDSPVTMTGGFSGDLKPDCIIPFKVDKKAAKASLAKHLEGKRLLPKVFREQNHIDEIKGVYVPVWLFDAGVDARISYKAQKRRTWSDSKFKYTEIKYYSAIRAGKIAYEHVPVDGSEKMDDALMESIEPFKYDEVVDFKTAYLSGYLADRYDVSAEDSIARANTRIKNSTEKKFMETVRGYDSVSPESTSLNLENGKAKYALYPVWLLNTSWNGEKFTFAMNGQTGKFVGNLPVDKAAAARWFVGVAAAVTAVVYFLLGFLLK